jgi:inner membrane protein
MNRSFIFKIIGMLILITLMSIAVSYVNGIILERQRNQENVKADIARSSAREQTVIGPVLVIPYVQEYPETIEVNKIQKIVTRNFEGKVYLLPDELNLKGGFTNEVKSLGIYKALMYQLGGSMNGQFKIPKNLGLKFEHDNTLLKISDAYLSVGIADTRGVSGKPIVNWGGQPISFEQGSKIDALGSGINAPIKNLTGDEQIISFDFKLNLRGTENFNFTPIAENNTIALNSRWQSPHFYGSFLPDAATQKIDSNGFSAKWAVSSLSSNNQSALINNLPGGANKVLETLSVGFVEPINVYSQSDRATKYGLLFIGLTFAGFFIFEILKRLRIHPAQYTLIGLAMALFYLLLVSLAERIGFAYAYLSASAACVGLLGYYLSYVLKSKANGMLFAGLLTALYGALYGILASEDNALLMGSLLVFGLLGLVMIITRKVDWYQISGRDSSQANAAYDVV